MCRKHYTRWHRWGDPLRGEGELPRSTPGVYSITCIVNGWVYIGSTQSVRMRWKGHKSHLRNHRHASARLQADWDEYGPDAFICELVSVITDKDERYDREQDHLDAAWATGKCYNQSPSARDNTGHRFTAEQARKVSDALTGKPKSAEHRANVWANREVTPEFTALMSRNGHMAKGKPKSAETRAKMSAAQYAGRPVLTEEIVRSIKRDLAAEELRGAEIARKYGITSGAVSSIKHGRNWAHVTLDDEPEGTLF